MSFKKRRIDYRKGVKGVFRIMEKRRFKKIVM